MRFGILGPVEAHRTDGSPVALGGPKVRALLALLLTDAGRVVSTDRLIDGLYAGEAPDGAANALQSQVSRLRRALGSSLVEFHPAGYRLAVDPDDVDAHLFERLVREGRQARDPDSAVKLLGEALALWRGRPPEDVGETYTARLDELWLGATEDLMHARLDLGHRRDLVPRLRELVAAHPLRERLRAQLMRALAGSGRQAEALAAFEDARRTLADELGTDPSAELTETHMAILRGEAEPVAVTPLPAQLTSFVGRAGELGRLGELLGRERLITLTGPGGTGKTRLAIEAASHAGNACFAELAPLTDGVTLAVLSALGLREAALSTRAAPVDRLVAALSERQVLLVLDNCEHVIEEAAALAARLLAACPALRILATSREPLGITGETLFPVPRLTSEPAVRLFTDRASAVRPDFAGADDDVALICQALDGLPLAIELAAARVRSLPAREIAARLDDRFGLLSKGSRTAEARHRTLRAVVEWSWDLLDTEERELARRLTAFAGSSTLDASERVCGLPGTIDLLTGLVDKSLVEMTGDRYRMLETIRAFCAERLAEAGETGQTRRAHAEYFLDFADSANPYLLSGDQLEWLARLDAEHDNLHAALRWAIDVDTALALRLVSALATYWWLGGRRFEGATLSYELATRLGPSAPDGFAEEYMLCVLTALSSMPDDESLRGHLDTVKTLAWQWDEPPRRPYLTAMLAPILGPPDDDETPDRPIGTDPWSQALGPLGRGYQALFRGAVNEAEHGLKAALARFRAIGERWGMMQAISELSRLVSSRGDHAEALMLINEGIEMVRELGATADIAELLHARGACRARAADVSGARADYEQSIDLARQSGAPEILARSLAGLADLALEAGDHAATRDYATSALAACGSEGFGSDGTRAAILITLARVAAGDEAISLLRNALGNAQRWRNLDTAASVAEALAELTPVPEDAARLLGASVALRGMVVSGSPVASGPAYTEGRALSHAEALDLLDQTFCVLTTKFEK